ncbi:hypothetical protein FB45DRAFT_785281 [Roridomyces roridus]|uniref:Uncharacterized protein n=1 Tax=Roridomyces roridus TaxID=1738132 RepID=A0AAD7C786_9AGAR|nr:hypothetical protein FB45DRAFT_785281 [Roridomyces roridus]
MALTDLAQSLANIVADGLDNNAPLDPTYRDQEICAVLLDRRPDLRVLVEAAHDAETYGVVREHPAIQRNDERDRLTSYLKDEIRPNMEKFALSADPLKYWTPNSALDADPETVAHIQSLRVPSVGKKPEPALLIHNLGRFGEHDNLSSRVADIFRKHSHTFLVNVSGSGKTRLSLEGLCRNWGFYFTMQTDGTLLGANDIGHGLYNRLDHAEFSVELPPPSDSEYHTKLERNRKSVDEKFGAVFLSRLLIFQMYLEILQSRPEGIKEEHKRRWVLFQLQPRFPDRIHMKDLFKDLKRFTPRLDSEEVLDMIAVMLFKLRRIHGPEFHLFCVLDEAQVVSRLHTEAFHHDGVEYPLLREIIQSWGAKSSPQELSFVTVGTDIPKDVFATASFADSMRWLSDTGGFDEKAVHRDYVAAFLPPKYRVSPAGANFLDRMWSWCRGRHRLTDGLIKALLMEAFRAPNRLLDAYIVQATRYPPTDNEAADEPMRINTDDYNRLHELSENMFLKDMEAGLLASTIPEVVFHYLATGRHPQPFPAEMPLVRSGFGRFIDGDMQVVVLNEPLFIVTAARWLFTDQPPLASTDTFHALTRHQEHITSKSFTMFLVFHFERAFATGAVLSDVFSIPHKPVPRWANQRAHLFARNEPTEDDFPATSAHTVTEVESWLDGATPSLFCLTPTSDPDLIFHLKLEDDKIIRVILHSVVTSTILQNAQLKQTMQRFEPSHLLREEGTADTDLPEIDRVVAKLLDTTQTDGPSHILHVVASFPAKTYLKTVPSKATSASVFANLNTGRFERLTAEIKIQEIMAHIVSAVTVGKRKRDGGPGEDSTDALPAASDDPSPAQEDDSPPPPASPAKRPSGDADPEASDAEASRAKKRKGKKKA